MDDKTHALYFIWEKNHGVSNKMTTMTSSGMEAIAHGGMLKKKENANAI